MATILSDNFNYVGQKPNFDRDIVDTKAKLKSVNVKYYIDGSFVYCKEDGKYYSFNMKYNSPTTGHFELFDFSNKNIGTTAQRPKFVLGTYKGYEYYDTDINQKIYWNGDSWENSDGTLESRVVVL